MMLVNMQRIYSIYAKIPLKKRDGFIEIAKNEIFFEKIFKKILTIRKK